MKGVPVAAEPAPGRGHTLASGTFDTTIARRFACACRPLAGKASAGAQWLAQPRGLEDLTAARRALALEVVEPGIPCSACTLISAPAFAGTFFVAAARAVRGPWKPRLAKLGRLLRHCWPALSLTLPETVEGGGPPLAPSA